jgi:RNA polymerase sigma-70 factor (ECF subfamily)
MPPDPVSILWQHLGAPSDGSANVPEALEGVLRAARDAWPGIDLPTPAFIAHLARRCRPGHPVADELRALEAADLFLACACLASDRDALAALDEKYLSLSPQVLAGISPSPAFTDEVVQRLRVRLLVGQGDGGPKLEEYSGRGSLRAWLRIATIRLALNLLRDEGRAGVPMAAPPTLSADLDPELVFLKEQYRAEFRSAFRQALGSLSAKEKNLLRLSYLDGLALEELGVIYGAHRTTVGRWIASARQRILDETRRLLTGRLQLTTAELESLMRIVQSQLDVTLHTLL